MGRANMEAERTPRKLLRKSGWVTEVAWTAVMIVGKAM